MSYLVLARKYRPRNFAEMVGQGHVVQALSGRSTQAASGSSSRPASTQRKKLSVMGEISV